MLYSMLEAADSYCVIARITAFLFDIGMNERWKCDKNSSSNKLHYMLVPDAQKNKSQLTILC